MSFFFFSWGTKSYVLERGRDQPVCLLYRSKVCVCICVARQIWYSYFCSSEPAISVVLE